MLLQPMLLLRLLTVLLACPTITAAITTFLISSRCSSVMSAPTEPRAANAATGLVNNSVVMLLGLAIAPLLLLLALLPQLRYLVLHFPHEIQELVQVLLKSFPLELRPVVSGSGSGLGSGGNDGSSTTGSSTTTGSSSGTGSSSTGTGSGSGSKIGINYRTWERNWNWFRKRGSGFGSGLGVTTGGSGAGSTGAWFGLRFNRFRFQNRSLFKLQ